MGGKRWGKRVVEEIRPRRGGASTLRVWRRIPTPRRRSSRARRSSGNKAVSPLPVARNTPIPSPARRSSSNKTMSRETVAWNSPPDRSWLTNNQYFDEDEWRTVADLVHYRGTCCLHGHCPEDRETCRWCGAVGHRSSRCPTTTPEMKARGRTEKKGQSSLEKETQQGQSHMTKTSGSLETSSEGKIYHEPVAWSTPPDPSWLRNNKYIDEDEWRTLTEEVHFCGTCLLPGHCPEDLRNREGWCPTITPEMEARRTEEGQSWPKKETETSEPLETSPEEITNHVSMVVDSQMVAMKKEFCSYSVATVVYTTQGVATAESIAAAMAIGFDPEWQWNVKPFRDGRFLLQFPSPELARDVENLGPVHFPGFCLSLCPWSEDLFPNEKLDRECRWVIIKRLPLYCMHPDTVARIIEPVGYLDTLKKGAYADQRRAYIRVRHGRRLPCIIHLSIESWKYVVTVDMETGQEPLPWDTYTPGKQTTPMTSRTEYGSSPGSMGATSDDDVDATPLTSDGDKSPPYDVVDATSDDDMDATSDEMDPTG